MLDFHCNEICDEGVAALVAPGEGVLPKLQAITLGDNRLTDAGCAALVAAIERGTLPRLRVINVQGNWRASEGAVRAAEEACRRAMMAAYTS